MSDIRYAVRGLLRRPGFTVVAVVTLALGIGVNTAMFSVVNAVLLRPLAYGEPARLIAFQSNQSGPDLADIEAQSRMFSSFGGEGREVSDYTGGSEPVQFRMGVVTGGYFQTLGVNAERGRFITAEDDRLGAPYVAVLSHSLWLRQFGGDTQIVGKTIPLSGNVYTVIGVMPGSFVSPRNNSEAWAPLHVSEPSAANDRGVHFLRSYARLAPGTSLDQARAEMQVIDKNLAAEDPTENKNRSTVLVPLDERIVGQSRQSLVVLFAAVSLVLLIACANFANLLLARAAERQREFVIRSALGAGRWRLVRQLLTESVLVSFAGGTIAVLLATWGISLLIALQPANLPRLQEIGVDARVLGFTFGLSLLTGIIFGLLPAWTATRSGLNEALKESGRRATAGGARQRLRSTFVIVEIAVALVLLAGAGLLIKTFWNLRSVEPGFQSRSSLTMHLELPEARYKEVDKQTRFRTQVLENIDSLPRTQAAMISELPLSGDSLDHEFVIDGRPLIAPGDEPSLESRSIIGDYFHVMKIPLRAGRNFGPQDFADKAPLVGIINEAMVQQYFRNEDPIGKRIRWVRDSEIHWITIVGVVGDVKHYGLDVPEQSALYSPYTQTSPWKRWMALVARTESEPAAMAQVVKQQVWKVDPQLPITKVMTMNEVAATSFQTRRFNMLLLAIFAGLALALAAVGIYGVMAYSVSQRTNEIGIRIALGAGKGSIFRLVVGQAMALVGISLLVGLAGAFAATRLLSSLLFGVGASDPPTFAGIVLLVSAVAFIAAWVPARRATRVDPIIALRAE